MRYSGVNQILEDQYLDNSYNEVITQNYPKDGTAVHNLNLYKVFYIFIIGSIFGCYMEQIRYYLQRGIWECRAGVIWGPFSEIYGVGAVILFFLYVKLRNKSPLTIFGLSSVCGAAFEYIANLFQEMTFHSITWDYSKQPFNLGGRTSLRFAVYWGLLGLFFIKIIYPVLDRQLDNIRGKFVIVFTWFFIIFMAANLLFSSIAVNRWNGRLQGIPSNGYVEEYMDSHYDNDKMKLLFPHMRFVDNTDKNI